MQDFRALRAWRAAHLTTLSVYKVSRGFPREELYGLTSQVRRAAVSVPANIAEGCGRHTVRDAARFFQVAMGSACEVEYLLQLARDLGLIGEASYTELDQAVRDVKRMLAGLLRHGRNRSPVR